MKKTQLFILKTDPLKNKNVLITGGTGSFGNAFVQYVLKNCQPKKLIIFSRDEFKQFKMSQRFPEGRNSPMRYFLGDVRDDDRLYRAFDGVDVVVHAAALKQVPAAEYNPFEFVKTNIIGAQNVINAAIDCGVKKVIALSTDKAANPINLYGATKLCSDKIFISGNAYSGQHSAKFSVVRYGNVLGSRGSVIPFFLNESKKGVLPITDFRMTRFWISLEEAVKFVLLSLEPMLGGEVFVPKIPSTKIVDIAKAIDPKCKLVQVGVRPGEKLHEVLITEAESINTREFKTHFVIQPKLSWWDEKNYNKGKKFKKECVYCSDQNQQWLTIKEIKEFIKTCKSSYEC